MTKTRMDRELDKKVKQLKKDGKNAEFIKSYIRGWKAVDKSISKAYTRTLSEIPW